MSNTIGASKIREDLKGVYLAMDVSQERYPEKVRRALQSLAMKELLF